MSTLVAYRSVKGSIHPDPAGHGKLRPASGSKEVMACGGTTIGNVNGCPSTNTSGTISVQQDLGRPAAVLAGPGYQESISVPVGLSTGQRGRGITDVAGNASENSGYLQVINGSQPQPVGDTSAVALLYAGLIARVNANLGHPVGFLNPVLYTLPWTTFREFAGTPGPANNSFGPVKGNDAGLGWDLCTGLGSIRWQALQTALTAGCACPAHR